MELLLILSREHDTLPKAEVIAVLESERVHFEIKCEYNGILVLNIADRDDWIINILAKRLGFLHEISELIIKTDINKLNTDVLEYSWKGVIDYDYAVRVKKTYTKIDLDSQVMESEIGGVIKRKLKNGAVVNLDNPKTFIRVLLFNRKVFVGKRLVKVNKKHFFNLKPHKRPFFYPGSMSPKLARCMVNLSKIKKGEILLDPFCGTGGILIEAGIIGAKLIGMDIDWKMVEGTRENLDFCGISDYKVYMGDARNIELPNKVDAIVTDPPYGISASTVGEKVEKLYQESLSSMQRIIKEKGYLCLATPHYLDLPRLINHTKFKIIEQHEIRMHKSLTRVISVLKKVY
ncbi:MAG: TIGR01177 family methyltransferase [Euryarchaeota archaeon]|nr:TIGR01177 family methyltransferase [Euryarchaeota archaeon]